MAPAYQPDKHQRYVEYLINALSLSETRNIAISGGYGTGKSSVLLGLATELGPKRVLQISLTELSRTGAEYALDAGESTVTAALQKEVVKRLLYSVKASALPRSRFSRIRGPKLLSTIGIGAVVSIPLVLAAMAFGIRTPLDGWATVLLPNATWVGRILDFLLLFAIAVVLRLLWAGSRINEVTVGPAKIALELGAGNYFDQYLDELIYFFQRTKIEVVLFEDLDRFRDPGIFQELRELNGILNNAKISQRIVFVYAMRDSLFREVATPEEKENADDGSNSPASNRSKFFDVVVPIAPFISQEVGSDLLSEELDLVPTSIRPTDDILALAGKYFADMRVLRSIRNEFLVFHKTVFEMTSVKGLSVDQLFAMVLFKHDRLADFERIQLGNSSLDRVVRTVAELVASRVASLDAEIASLMDESSFERRAVERASSAGERLRSALESVLAIISVQVVRIEVGSGQYPPPMWSTLDFWQSMAASEGGSAIVTLSNNSRANVLVTRLLQIAGESSLLASLAGGRKEAAAEAERLREIRAGLLAASFDQRALDPAFNGSGIDGEYIDIPAQVEAILGTGLALDLVRAGYIDQSFALYTTVFRGKFVSANARSFILQSVDRHASAPLFRLSDDDIRAVAGARGSEFFDDTSVFNVDVFDELMDDDRLVSAFRRLPTASEAGAEFLSTYLNGSKKPDRIFPKLTPHYPGVINAIFDSSRISEEKKVGFLIEAMSNLSPAIAYELSDLAQEFVVSRVVPLVIRRTTPSDNASALAQLLARQGIRLGALVLASGPMVEAIANHRAFEITRDNLVAVVGPKRSLGLDTIGDVRPAIFDFIREELDSYLDILKVRDRSLDEATRLGEIVAALSATNDATLSRFLAKTPANAKLDLTDDIPFDHWHALASAAVINHTVTNVGRYIERFGAQDALLPRVVGGRTRLESEELAAEPIRRSVALAIAAASMPARQRCNLVDGLKLASPLTIADVPVDDSTFIGLMLKRGLLPDIATTFDGLTEAPWRTREMAIAASKNYEKFVQELTLIPGEISRILNSTAIAASVQKTLVDSFDLFARTTNQADFDSLLKYSSTRGRLIPDAELIAIAVKASPREVADYLGFSTAEWTLKSIQSVLLVLPGEYSKLAQPGERPTLPETDGLRALIRKLQAWDVAGKAIERKGDRVQVFMKSGR